MNARAIFLDRDGTIMEDTNYVGQVERVSVIPGAVAALKRLQAAGYRLFVITNQSGVGRGYFTRAAVEQIHAHLNEQFGRQGVQFERYYVCPHHPDDGCDCRKPKAKFLLDAAAEYGVDLSRSYMIGDRPSDVQAGINAGTQTVLVLTGAGRETLTSGQVQPDLVANDLPDAAEKILSRR